MGHVELGPLGLQLLLREDNIQLDELQVFICASAWIAQQDLFGSRRSLLRKAESRGTKRRDLLKKKKKKHQGRDEEETEDGPDPSDGAGGASKEKDLDESDDDDAEDSLVLVSLLLLLLHVRSSSPFSPGTFVPLVLLSVSFSPPSAPRPSAILRILLSPATADLVAIAPSPLPLPLSCGGLHA